MKGFLRSTMACREWFYDRRPDKTHRGRLQQVYLLATAGVHAARSDLYSTLAGYPDEVARYPQARPTWKVASMRGRRQPDPSACCIRTTNPRPLLCSDRTPLPAIKSHRQLTLIYFGLIPIVSFPVLSGIALSQSLRNGRCELKRKSPDITRGLRFRWTCDTLFSSTAYCCSRNHLQYLPRRQLTRTCATTSTRMAAMKDSADQEWHAGMVTTIGTTR